MLLRHARSIRQGRLRADGDRLAERGLPQHRHGRAVRHGGVDGDGDPREQDSARGAVRHDQAGVGACTSNKRREDLADDAWVRSQKGHFHVREAFEESLKTLDVGYIDL